MTSQTKLMNVLGRLGLAATITVGACLSVASQPVAAETYLPRPIGPELNVLQSCVGKKDRIDVLLVNDQSRRVTYTAQLVPAVTGDRPFARKARAINATEHRQLSLWVPETAIDQSVLVVSRDDVEIYREPVSAYCADGSIAPDMPETTVTNACRGDKGFVRVSVVNSDDERHVWSFTVTNSSDPDVPAFKRRLAVSPRTSRSVTIGQKTPGVYIVRFFRDGEQVGGAASEIECDFSVSSDG